MWALTQVTASALTNTWPGRLVWGLRKLRPWCGCLMASMISWWVASSVSTSASAWADILHTRTIKVDNLKLDYVVMKHNLWVISRSVRGWFWTRSWFLETGKHRFLLKSNGRGGGSSWIRHKLEGGVTNSWWWLLRVLEVIIQKFLENLVKSKETLINLSPTTLGNCYFLIKHGYLRLI